MGWLGAAWGWGQPWGAVVTLPCPLQHKYTSIAEVQVHMEEEYLRSPLSGVSVGLGWDGHPGRLGWELGELGPASFFGRAKGFALLRRGFSGAEGVWAGVGGILPLGSCSMVLVAAPGMRFSGLSWHRGKRKWSKSLLRSCTRACCPACPSTW